MFVDLPTEYNKYRRDHGIYEAHINVIWHTLRRLIKTKTPHSDALTAFMRKRIDGEDVPDFDWENTPPDYGVCDVWPQILRRWPRLIDDPDRKYVITIWPIFKEDQPEDGGWRWHKWGPYVGTHEITSEYLYDEDGIDHVYIFDIIEMK